MLVVKIELWPRGDESKSVELHRGFITNDGTGDSSNGNYKVKLNEKGNKDRLSKGWKTGYVKGFKRKKLLAWDLLLMALVPALGADRIKKYA